MEFSKADKVYVIEWIDQQFAHNDLFPCKCTIEDGSDEPHVCASHMKAYLAWSMTPHKRSHIRGWIEEWLNQDDQAALENALQHRYG